MSRVEPNRCLGGPIEGPEEQAKESLFDTVRSLVPPKPYLKFVFGDKSKKSAKRKKKSHHQNNQTSQAHKISSLSKSKSAKQKHSLKKTSSRKLKQLITSNKDCSQKHGPPYRPTILSQKELFGKSADNESKKKKRKIQKQFARFALALRQQMHTQKTYQSKGQSRTKRESSNSQSKPNILHMNIDKCKQTIEPKTQKIIQEKCHLSDSTKCLEKQQIITEVEFKSTAKADGQILIQKLKFKHKNQASRRRSKPSAHFKDGDRNMNQKQELNRRSEHDDKRDEERNIAQTQVSDFSKKARKQAIQRRLATFEQQSGSHPENKLKKWKH